MKRYEIWKRIVEHDGIVGLQKISGFNDELLTGRWLGYRLSRLNKQWRVIYKIKKQELSVYVIDVNPHKY